MKLSRYVKEALRTAEPAALEPEYLEPGLVAEAGELFGQLAKGFWHEKEPEVINFELQHEWGDLAWLTAIQLHVLDPNLPEAPLSPREVGGRRGALSVLLNRVGGIYTNGATYLRAYALWQALEDYSEVVTGAPFDRVLQMNLAKLKERQEKGVLRGDGDHR